MAAIQTEGLTKKYGSTTALSGLDLVVEEGEVFGFLGPNGAGKSTTINLLLDFVRPTAGSGRVLGMDTRTESVLIRERVGVLPEGLGLYDRLTGLRHLEFAIGWKDASETPEELLDRVGLDAVDADRTVQGYSKGMKQRLALAMALVGGPDLLIMDEPSTGLDPNGIRDMQTLIREEVDTGTTVFFSSHILGQVEAVCDRIGILHNGRLVAIDTIDGLREVVGGSSDLILRVGESADVDVGDLPGVRDVVKEAGQLRISCDDGRDKARIVAELHNRGLDIIDIDAAGATLDDIFTTYTTDVEQPQEETA